MYFGIYINNWTEAVNGGVLGLTTAITYLSSTSGPNGIPSAWPTSQYPAGVPIQLVDFAPDYSTTVAGTNDTALEAFFDTAPNNSWVMPIHECNLGGGQNLTGTQVQALDTYIIPVMKGVNSTLLYGRGMATSGKTPFTDYFSSSIKYDFFGMDGYQGSDTTKTPTTVFGGPTNPAKMLGAFLSVNSNVPIAIIETGTAIPVSNGTSTWLNEIGSYAVSNNLFCVETYWGGSNGQSQAWSSSLVTPLNSLYDQISPGVTYQETASATGAGVLTANGNVTFRESITLSGVSLITNASQINTESQISAVTTINNPAVSTNGAAELAGAGNLSSVTSYSWPAVANPMGAEGNIIGAGSPLIGGGSAIESDSSITASAVLNVTANLSGAGVTKAVSSETANGTASITSSGNVSGNITAYTAASLNCTGTVSDSWANSIVGFRGFGTLTAFPEIFSVISLMAAGNINSNVILWNTIKLQGSGGVTADGIVYGLASISGNTGLTGVTLQFAETSFGAISGVSGGTIQYNSAGVSGAAKLSGLTTVNTTGMLFADGNISSTRTTAGTAVISAESSVNEASFIFQASADLAGEAFVDPNIYVSGLSHVMYGRGGIKAKPTVIRNIPEGVWP